MVVLLSGFRQSKCQSSQRLVNRHGHLMVASLSQARTIYASVVAPVSVWSRARATRSVAEPSLTDDT